MPLGAVWAAESAVGGRTLMIEELSRELFSKHVGEHFTVSAEGVSPVTLKLARVVDVPSRPQGAGAPVMESFSVVFEGDAGTNLAQSSYSFENPRMGSVTLFAVPVVSSDQAVRNYEVVINRLVQA
jgi:hypothetical protein